MKEILHRFKAMLDKIIGVKMPDSEILRKLKTILFRLIVIDGLDGAGKGVAIRGLVKFFGSLGLRIFDVDKYCKKYNCFPQFQDPDSAYYINPQYYHIFVVSEPTYCLTGKAIREEIIAKNQNRSYSAQVTAEAYSLDRAVLYKRVVLPLLALDKIVIESRSVTTSVAYQPVQAGESDEVLSVDQILALPGNSFVLRRFLGLLIIPIIEDVPALEKRLSNRSKDDNCIFENLPFQLKLNEVYKSEWFKKLFEGIGMNIEYIDAGVSPEATQQAAVKAVKKYFGI